jgi:DNA-binding CsgD family transcriptional regulator
LLHAFLAVYILSFSLGLIIITLSLVAHARFGMTPLRHIALLFGSAFLLLLCAALKTYEQATAQQVFGKILPVLSLVLAVPGNALLVTMICIIASEVVLLPVSPARMALHVGLAIAAAGLGGLREMLPGRVFLFLNEAVVTGVQLYAILVIAPRLANIRHPRLLSLVRSVEAVALVMVLAAVIQLVGQAAFLSPAFLDDFPLAQVLFYLILVGILLAFAVQYLFQPEFALAYQLPDEIVREYGISPREREIITMLVQGYNNRVIGEKLFISSITVKNHIYHIYQKTGVTNKIQLINLINSPK